MSAVCFSIWFAEICIDLPVPVYCDENRGNIFRWNAGETTRMLANTCSSVSKKSPPTPSAVVRLAQVTPQ